ncbi:TPA: hypothetical protein G8S59_004047 [Salmonella enterica]|uniref:Uncharacterized protein n=1 Tax=Salmonella enterica TaxID=28901 RepID=A0A756YCU4_SALER|nr:hypothetical protein [Salmonella enterica subsp. enterica serovar Richmond]HAG0390750.1 hypothetical protein [Salmonella enterica]
MNINRIPQATIISDSDQNKNEQLSKLKRTDDICFHQKGVKVKLTRQMDTFLNDSRNDINMLSVAHVKDQLEKGNIDINSDKIAAALVKDIFDFS